jgi:ectoine hydroxylase-related dioxygenase (phytanoyl-CoA dioxygenase family)
MNSNYQEHGYCVVKRLFAEQELADVRRVLLKFHESWKRKNSQLYADKAINSAYLTGTEHLDAAERRVLFDFIGAKKIMDVVLSVLPEPAFMNTQLFFNPVDAEQKNYWHRDPQYHLSVQQQRDALRGAHVVHFRIPLVDEPGLEVVPGTHKRWDSDEELDVRLQRNQRMNHEPLSSGVTVELEAGDLMVFSANMLHRGLYGMDRFALDILFCDPDPKLMKFVSADCLPDHEIIDSLAEGIAFSNALRLIATCSG